MKCISVENSLNTFRENYPGVRVTQFADCLVYRVVWGGGTKAAKKANEIIERLELDLVAIPAKGISDNSFCVQSIHNEAL